MNSFSFAHRTLWPQEANALNKALQNLQVQGKDILDLTQSNPTDCGFVYPQDWLKTLELPDNFFYKPDSQGLLGARQAVARHYKQAVAAQNIILTASTSEAYSFLFRLLVNPGEKVLIPRPSYPLFQFLLDINDVKFDYYPLIYEDGWHIDLAALERLVDEKTRAIILVNPNNPTGSYIEQAELEFINRLCRRHNMSIIADEVFFDYVWGPGNLTSCVGNQEVLTFSLSGVSKTLCLPQMKCAWILASGPQGILHEAMKRLEIIADTYLSVNTPVQNALGIWLKDAQHMQNQVMSRVKQNWQWFSKNLDGHTQLLACQGGWYATLRIPAIKSEEEWALEFLKDDHVLVYPGYFFDMTGGAYSVVSLLPPVSIFQEAWGRIRKRIAQGL